MTSIWQGKRIALAAGGTGGHVYPALAVLHELKEQEPPPEILFLGRPYGLEHDLMTRENVNYIHLSILGFPRKPSLRWLTAPLLALGAFLKCLCTFIGKRPHLVIGFGSYVAAPVVLAALCLRIPTLIHEQNTYPGVANRYLAPWVTAVLVSYPDTPALLHRSDAQVVGIPLRKEVLKKNTGCVLPELQSHLKTLLIFGGSQGARKICRSAIEALPLLEKDLEGWQTVLIAGPNNYEQIHSQKLPENLILKDYIESMGAIYQVSALVVSRAGAVSLAEITAYGLPAVLIPLAIATGDHQAKNAQVLKENGAAVIIDNADLSPEVLAETLRPLIQNPKRLEKMAKASMQLGRPEAAKAFIEQIERVLK